MTRREWLEKQRLALVQQRDVCIRNLGRIEGAAEIVAQLIKRDDDESDELAKEILDAAYKGPKVARLSPEALWAEAEAATRQNNETLRNLREPAEAPDRDHNGQDTPTFEAGRMVGAARKAMTDQEWADAVRHGSRMGNVDGDDDEAFNLDPPADVGGEARDPLGR